MDTALKVLEKRVRYLTLYAAGLTAVLAFVILSGFVPQKGAGEILRVKGIIVTDEEGNDRILIGAPIPASAPRIRTDLARAKETWGKRYPRFDWYEKLNHQTNGILILDGTGHDRIAIGDPVPDPNIGQRIAPSVGMLINDAEGFERSGWGYFPDKGRTVFGIDDEQGEGAILGVLEDGTKGLHIMNGKERLFIGAAPGGSFATGLAEPFSGVFLSDSNGVVRKF